ncbi:MAG: NUDIX domain-containing protein [Bacilli bacterium]|nr:NUDIX domain-containing protein [Bacilli bacterium]
MLTIRNEKERFIYRVAGIIYNKAKDKVLIHRAIWQDTWILPGGRMSMGENTLDGIKRELKEELGIINEKVELKYIAESFFYLNNQKHHELGFFYELIIDEKKYDLNKEGEFLGLEEDDQIFKWVLISDLDNYVFRPKKLKEMIKEVPEKLNHLIINDTIV